MRLIPYSSSVAAAAEGFALGERFLLSYHAEFGYLHQSY